MSLLVEQSYYFFKLFSYLKKTYLLENLSILIIKKYCPVVVSFAHHSSEVSFYEFGSNIQINRS